jgi:aryl-alcohol dehydrogenase-like predicted oxidoreductase
MTGPRTVNVPAMKKRILGRTGWQVSEIGFGAWGIGAAWWGPTDDKASLAALRAAWDAGINFYDTAYIYGDGHSEKLIAEALEGKPAVIATKVPPKNNMWPPTPKTPVRDAFPADWIVSCTERSLKNLRRETIDLTQLHVWTDAWLEDGEWQEAASRLKAQGKIRAFGVSINDHDPGSALRLVKSGMVDSVQVIFNIFDQSPVKELFPACRERNVGVIARVPFDEGGLTGTLTRETRFEKGDFRGSYFRGDNLAKTVDRAEKLKKLLNGEARTLPELALKFILGHPEVSTVIPGMRQARHVASNVAVSGAPPLSPGMMAELRRHAWPRNFYGMWD